MRLFYLIFKKSQPLAVLLTWTNICLLLPIKNENKRNYYINMCIKKNLSKRELQKEIKNNSNKNNISIDDAVTMSLINNYCK
jgi:predicted nuclease of restriction endonuclease-like (RecB) superfamily